MKILIVEDSTAMRAFVRDALEQLVCEAPPGASLGQGAAHGAAGLAEVDVVEAANGFEALRLLPRGPYDLVVTDINMPDVNGLELIRFMRGHDLHRGTPILLISTQSSERDRERGLALGANGYLAKPFSPEQLRELAAAVLA